ncbi:hypothetical protein [Gemella morbillorum]
MKRYEFTATTAKSDIVIGLIFPMVIMIPILAIQLAVFYLKLNNFVKAYPIFLFLLVLVFFGGGFLLIRKIQERLVKDYIVELYGKNIRILENEEEIISGVVSFCEIKNKNVGGRALSVDIYTDTDEIKFRTRCKEYKKITGVSTRNPFGTSELSDLETLLSLGRKIQNITEE